MARVVSSRKRDGKGTFSRPLFLALVLILAIMGFIFFSRSGNKGATGNDSVGNVEIPASPLVPIYEKTSTGTAGRLVTQDELGALAKERQVGENRTDGRAASEEESKLSAEEEWRIADSNRLAVSEALLRSREPKKHFDNEVENTLEIVSKPGAQFLQIPVIDMAHEDIIAFLKKPVEILPDDDEATIAAKERTVEVKAAALEYIEKGGTINQFIRDTAAAEQEAVATRDEVRMEMRRILASEGEEMAQAYLDEINPQLAKLGIKEIKIGRGDRKFAETRRLKSNQ